MTPHYDHGITFTVGALILVMGIGSIVGTLISLGVFFGPGGQIRARSARFVMAIMTGIMCGSLAGAAVFYFFRLVHAFWDVPA